jgi:hypothetical protein
VPERRSNDTDPDLRILEEELAREAAVARAEGRSPYPPRAAGGDTAPADEDDAAPAPAPADEGDGEGKGDDGDGDGDGDDGTDERRSSGERTPVDR